MPYSVYLSLQGGRPDVPVDQGHARLRGCPTHLAGMLESEAQRQIRLGVYGDGEEHRIA